MSIYPSDRNIIITGFMGTGKSTIGRMVAEELGREFVDMDNQIEANFGRPIAQIFADEGEDAFRLAEAQLCAKLAERKGLVVSTGGGALLNTSSRQALAESGAIICLTASLDEIMARIAAATDRPLLPGDADEKRSRIRDLLHARRQVYATIPIQVDTSGDPPARIAPRVLRALAADREVAGMTLIPVASPSGSYDICIGEGLLDSAGTLLHNRGLQHGPVAVVTNAMIAPTYAQVLKQTLYAAGYEAHICVLPEGEQHKTLESIHGLYDQFLDAGLDRKSAVISLGGGVIGDMAGFAAASYLRGVPFVQIPTSLLAMVDASVGGKTGVDLPQGKNLVGAFKQPALVIMDVATLETLPAAEFRAGMAEIIKHGILANPDLFEQIETHGPTSLVHLVADAVRVKVDVVEEDPFEQGRRATLNLGHTFGHAIEHVSGLTMRHGDCVAIGLVAAAKMAADLGRCDAALAGRIEAVVDRVGLPTRAPQMDAKAVMDAMWYDKKRAGKNIRFIVPQALGDVVIIDNPGDEAVRRAVDYVLNVQ